MHRVQRRRRLSEVAIALVYLLAITVNEVLTTLVEPRWGLFLHSSLLLIMLVHTALVWERPLRDLLLSLSFAPLIRLVSLSLPLVQFPILYWYLITSVPLFISVFIAMRTLRYDGRDVGLTWRGLFWQVPVGAMGLLFGVSEYYILRPQPLAQGLTLQQLWQPALILLISTGFAEEIIFRGLMQRAGQEVLGGFNVLYVSLLFAVLHVGYRSALDLVFVLVVAIIWGYIREWTDSIVGVSLAHGLTNIVLFLIAPFVL